MNNFDDLFEQQPQAEAAPQKQESRKERPKRQWWQVKEEKQRKEAYATLDRIFGEFSEGTGSMEAYLDVQSRFPFHSARNALLIGDKCPDAVRVGGYKEWHAQGIEILEDEKRLPIIILEPGKAYRREDGSVGQNFYAKEVYDISQTTARDQVQPQVRYDDRLLLKGLIASSPVPIRAVEELPQGRGAMFSAEQNAILVKKGMDAPDIFRCVSLEVANVQLAQSMDGYSRETDGYKAYAVSYMLCKRYGVDAKEYEISKLDGVFQGQVPREDIPAALTDMRDTFKSLNGRMARANMVTELTDFNRNLMFSIDIVPVPTDEAVREVENRLLGVETNITNWQRRQNANNNFSAVVPYDMELQRKESKEFLDDLTTRDQRMMFAVMTLAITADTKEQLDSDTEAVLSVARKHMCQLAVLKFQQLDGLNTALPIGVRKINAFRTLTTESLAVFIPFKVQEIQDKGGIYFGENAISHNLILCNKANLLNQSAFLLGVPGAGKSFSAKELIAFLMLHPDYANDDILICDPEGEFGALVKALGQEKATVAHLVAGGKDRLNAMYMVEGYGEQNPIVEKSQFVMSLIEQIDKRGVGPQHKSIIDRCTAMVYPEAEKIGRVATLCDLRNKLLEQPEDKAKEIALSLELYTTGSLDIFGRESTVDLNKPYVVFDIHGLGEQLKPAGSLVITDTILNRVTLNWKRGKRTHVFTHAHWQGKSLQPVHLPPQ